MNMVVAFLRPHRRDAVARSLQRLETFPGMAVTAAKRVGRLEATWLILYASIVSASPATAHMPSTGAVDVFTGASVGTARTPLASPTGARHTQLTGPISYMLFTRVKL